MTVGLGHQKTVRMGLEDCCKVDIHINSPLSSSSFGSRFSTVWLGHYTWCVDSYIFLLFSYSIRFILVCSFVWNTRYNWVAFILLLRNNRVQLKKKIWPFNKEEWVRISNFLHSPTFGSRFGTVRLGHKCWFKSLKIWNIKVWCSTGLCVRTILFSIYNSPIEFIFEKHNICYHLYADDGQLYLAFSPKDSLPQEEAKEKMMKCVKDVKSFLTFNKMKQNDDKTEFLIIGTPGQLKRWMIKIYTFVKQKYLHLNKHVIVVSFLIKNWIIFPRQDTIMWET